MLRRVERTPTEQEVGSLIYFIKIGFIESTQTSGRHRHHGQILGDVGGCLYTLYMSTFPISPGGSASSTRPQLVPQFDQRFSVLPDQLVTRQDVPAAGEQRASWDIYITTQTGNRSPALPPPGHNKHSHSKQSSAQMSRVVEEPPAQHHAHRVHGNDSLQGLETETGDGGLW